jgi:sporulation protein YlmC with PRC-barrel domain
MAGAGVRLFTAGSQLLASQVNTYLMDQVVCYFADSASRDAAFGGAGEPSLSPGRICYLFSDNKLYLYGNDNAWAEIGAQLDNLEVTTAKIDNLAVTEGKLADGAVTSTKILDGTILNVDINASAAIALSKLASGSAAQVVVHNASGVPTATTISGDVTVNSSGVTAIGSGVVVNADVSSSAAIDYSKLASLTAGSVLLGNSSNVATVTALSGDVTVNSSGVTAIGSGVIINDDINASAGIALSKLATSTAGNIIVYNSSGIPTAVAETGDISISDTGVTAIASGVIVNADISSSASIELGKLANVSIDTKTANYTLVLTDANKIIEMNLTGTANTVSVPTNASVAFPIGTQINITQYGTGKTQIVAVTSGTTSIRSTPGSYLRDRYSSATLIKRATDEWYLIGDLSAT